MAVLERIQTFFIEMTKSGEINYIDSKDIQKAVREVKKNESGVREELEKNVEDVYIPLEEDETVVKRVKVNEQEAQQVAEAKGQSKKKETQERQR